MARKYENVKLLLPAVRQMQAEGKTRKEISGDLGLQSERAAKDPRCRARHRQEKAIPKQRGRTPAAFPEANGMMDRCIHFCGHARIRLKTGYAPLARRRSWQTLIFLLLPGVFCAACTHWGSSKIPYGGFLFSESSSFSRNASADF